ncbi:hypothetical protein FNL37_0776 [Methylovorus glucosotrophus]|uniref:DUF6691 family protein n=1 Tax=Methylovorus glucosotrophus TaxID=266009 RepID=UPI0013311AE1|nr:DUF6691 family protein [Methylovorus glucosotrophus]KAF0843351.1 hypothetical protein FNL37_0776 [Methylovorus glucosotrophus]
MRLLTAFVSGLIFGLGLIISGMTNPAKVIGFLDIFGHWDPSLGLVMGGAILVGVFAFAYAKSRKTSLLGNTMQLPTSQEIDKKLLGGSLLFGIGWGLAGYCPGPAIASLLSDYTQPLIFTAAMLGGMWVSSKLS